MDDLQEKMSAVLNDPQMMQQILSMAQALGGQNETSQEAPSTAASASFPDPELLKKLGGIAGHNNIDRNQQALLKALGPYLQKERIHKLERAMRAARMARFASSALGPGGLQALLGR